MSAAETSHRRKQRLWFNNYIDSLADQVQNVSLNHPGDAARRALFAAAELIRQEKKDAPGIVTASSQTRKEPHDHKH